MKFNLTSNLLLRLTFKKRKGGRGKNAYLRCGDSVVDRGIYIKSILGVSLFVNVINNSDICSFKKQKMKIVSNPVLSKPILSQLETIDFIEDINRNCTVVDSDGLKKTLIKYNLLNHTETHDFLLQADTMFAQFNKNPNIKVLCVVKFDTKCIACSFGKNVIGYNVEYSKKENGLNLIYNWNFGINLSIQKDRLFDFAHCNGFLSSSEYKNI